MNEVLKCPDCGTTYYSDSSPVCPMCGDMDGAVSSSSKPTVRASKKIKPEVELSSDTLALINAQDRTTYAIRSIANFLFISICTTALGYGLIGAGAGSAIACAYRETECGQQGLVIFGWFVITVGFFAALGVGISQLNRSRIS